MKRYFLADEDLVDRLTVKKQTVEEAEESFRDKFGYYPDIVKEIDALGGTIKVIKDGVIKESCAKTEALHGQEEIEKFAKMANQIGLKTMGDLKKFLDQEGEGKDVLTALKDYLVNDLGDINFQAKNESIGEGKSYGRLFNKVMDGFRDYAVATGREDELFPIIDKHENAIDSDGNRINPLKEDYPDEEWEEVSSKTVQDSDGFYTDYTWYTNGNKHVFVFGDSEVYRPEDGDYDWEIEVIEGKEAEAYKEAQEWFNTYEGFEDELDEHVAVDRYKQLNDKNSKPVVVVKSNAKGEILKESKEDKDELEKHLNDAIKRDEKKLEIAKKEAEKDPAHKEFFDKMIKDLERHINVNKEKLGKILMADEEEINELEVLSTKLDDASMKNTDTENELNLKNADKIHPDLFARDSEVYKKLERASEIFNKKSPNRFRYEVGNTYLDFGSGYQWTTIIATKRDGSTYQVLSPNEWEDIVNAKEDSEVERVIAKVLSDKCNPDKKKKTIDTVEDALKALNSIN